MFFFFFKQKTAYEMRISDWSSDVCSSDLVTAAGLAATLARLAPGELVLADRLLERPEIAEAFAGLKDRLTPLPAARFDSANGVRRLEELFEVKALDAFGAFGRAELAAAGALVDYVALRSEEHTSELQSLMRISYAGFCMHKTKYIIPNAH